MNVIYHGDSTIVRRTICEIRRVLRTGGFHQGNHAVGVLRAFREGTEVAPLDRVDLFLEIHFCRFIPSTTPIGVFWRAVNVGAKQMADIRTIWTGLVHVAEGFLNDPR